MSERKDNVIWVSPPRGPSRTWQAGGLIVAALVVGLALAWLAP